MNKDKGDINESIRRYGLTALLGGMQNGIFPSARFHITIDRDAFKQFQKENK